MIMICLLLSSNVTLAFCHLTDDYQLSLSVKKKHQFQGSHGTCGETVMGVYTMLMTPKNLLGTSELSKVKPVP